MRRRPRVAPGDPGARISPTPDQRTAVCRSAHGEASRRARAARRGPTHRPRPVRPRRWLPGAVGAQGRWAPVSRGAQRCLPRVPRAASPRAEDRSPGRIRSSPRRRGPSRPAWLDLAESSRTNDALDVPTPRFVVSGPAMRGLPIQSREGWSRLVGASMALTWRAGSGAPPGCRSTARY